MTCRGAYSTYVVKRRLATVDISLVRSRLFRSPELIEDRRDHRRATNAEQPVTLVAQSTGQMTSNSRGVIGRSSRNGFARGGNFSSTVSTTILLPPALPMMPWPL